MMMMMNCGFDFKELSRFDHNLIRTDAGFVGNMISFFWGQTRFLRNLEVIVGVLLNYPTDRCIKANLFVFNYPCDASRNIHKILFSSLIIECSNQFPQSNSIFCFPHICY